MNDYIAIVMVLAMPAIGALILWRATRPNPKCTECGRTTWYSAYADGYYCEHGRHLRDMPSIHDDGKVVKSRMGLPIEGKWKGW
jgi:hypothetical protein